MTATKSAIEALFFFFCFRNKFRNIDWITELINRDEPSAPLDLSTYDGGAGTDTLFYNEIFLALTDPTSVEVNAAGGSVTVSINGSVEVTGTSIESLDLELGSENVTVTATANADYVLLYSYQHHNGMTALVDTGLGDD